MPKKPKQPKRCNYYLIDRDERPVIYEMLEHLISHHHPHLADAKIALAWRYEIKPDVDGRLVLGQCRKASDLDRKLHDFDFIILLNAEWWNRAETTTAQQRALMDHELCHAAESIDPETGEPKVNADGRQVWRIRKHDFEDFHEVVARNGFYKRDLEALAEEAIRRERSKTPLFEDPEADDGGGDDDSEHAVGGQGDDDTKVTITMNAAARKIKGRE